MVSKPKKMKNPLELVLDYVGSNEQNRLRGNGLLWCVCNPNRVVAISSIFMPLFNIYELMSYILCEFVGGVVCGTPVIFFAF